MKIGMIIAAVFAILVAAWSLYFLIKSSKWESTQGKVREASIEEIQHRANTKAGELGNLFDYRLNIHYDYSVNGKAYSGTRLYPKLPNIFSDKTLAERTLATYPAGTSVTVYYDTKHPNQASLITTSGIGLKGIMIISGLFLFVVAFVGGGIFVFTKL